MKVRCSDIEIAYDREGEGTPVLLVMGLATTRIGWIMQMSALSKHHDVVCFDNRGMGETTVPDEPWTMDTMVSDAFCLVDALGWDRFHLVGVSMGGMIAQEMVLSQQDRIRSLTLISTQHGGPDHVMPSDRAMQLFGFDGDPVARLALGIDVTFGRRYREEHPEVIETLKAFAVANPPARRAVESQALAVGMWSNMGGTADRLGEIVVPTLVLHGTDDELVAFGNGELIASKIKDAEFIPFPEAGHALITERAPEVNEAILAHLAAADAADG
ncbi:MAG TPA: alpha/beta fold hydrolase [Actinomycetota bacterium]|nr:alpha/beta fold hydrolase [Actinomycetota bacterium]